MPASVAVAKRGSAVVRMDDRGRINWRREPLARAIEEELQHEDYASGHIDFGRDAA